MKSMIGDEIKCATLLDIESEGVGYRVTHLSHAVRIGYEDSGHSSGQGEIVLRWGGREGRGPR